MIEIMEGSGWDFHTTELGYSHRLLCLHVDGFENQVHLQKKKRSRLPARAFQPGAHRK
jgi:hypothetical protein